MIALLAHKKKSPTAQRSNKVTYRNAQIGDIPGVMELQQKYHINFIKEEDKKDGFVTTLFSKEQLTSLVLDENGLFIACDKDKIAGYAMAASWDYWSAWPFFRLMIEELPLLQFNGQEVTIRNSYQYGPICIDGAYRGSVVLKGLFDYARAAMAKRYTVLVTFINQINKRSIEAHVRKLGLKIARAFNFNNNNYYVLVYDVKVPLL